MDFFANAKAVRLRSHHDKYLTADDGEESVIQDRNARWSVEFVSSADVRLKSRYDKYLTASDHPFLLGMASRKVVQSLLNRLDSSIEWEPIRQGKRVKLRTRYGNFLRANDGLPPWRNSVTHDVPHRSSTQEWVLWDVDVVDILERREQGFENKNATPAAVAPPTPPPSKLAPVHPHQVADSDSFDSDASFNSPSETPNGYSRQEDSDGNGTHIGDYQFEWEDVHLKLALVEVELRGEAFCDSSFFVVRVRAPGMTTLKVQLSNSGTWLMVYGDFFNDHFFPD